MPLSQTAPLASLFILSHNKPAYVPDAIRSALDQDYPDLEIWVLENSTDDRTRTVIASLVTDSRIRYEEIDLDPAERAGCYVPAMLLNRYYPKASGKYIFYLSDDDLLDPACVTTCVGFMEAAPDRHVCFFSHRHQTLLNDGSFVLYGGILAVYPMGLGTERFEVDSRIDGGQIAHRRSCLDQIDQPWFPESAEQGSACHADGLFMQKLANLYTFHPVGADYLATARRTDLSLWNHT